LRDLARRDGQASAFEQRFAALCAEHARKPSLIARLRAGRAHRLTHGGRKPLTVQYFSGTAPIFFGPGSVKLDVYRLSPHPAIRRRAHTQHQPIGCTP
jgi:hypothetical protein